MFYRIMKSVIVLVVRLLSQTQSSFGQLAESYYICAQLAKKIKTYDNGLRCFKKHTYFSMGKDVKLPAYKINGSGWMLPM
jgi:hypothetical protein